jgi:Ca2+-binding EF-hand superfamily protein
MTPEEKKELKRQFEKTKKSSKLHHVNGAMMDAIIKKHFSFHYSERDLEPIIDTLDYASNAISFETFLSMMEEEQQKVNEEKED